MRVDDLLVEGLHHRQGMRVQHPVLVQDERKVTAAEGTEVGERAAGNAKGCRSFVGFKDHVHEATAQSMPIESGRNRRSAFAVLMMGDHRRPALAALAAVCTEPFGFLSQIVFVPKSYTVPN